MVYAPLWDSRTTLRMGHLTSGGVVPKTSGVVTQIYYSYPQNAW